MQPESDLSFSKMHYILCNSVWTLVASSGEVAEWMQQSTASLPPPKGKGKENYGGHLSSILHLELHRLANLGHTFSRLLTKTSLY